MLVDALRNQWVCSCGNWVDGAFEWCPHCCEYKFTYHYTGRREEERLAQISS
jgi:hypothetical protein